MNNKKLEKNKPKIFGIQGIVMVDDKKESSVDTNFNKNDKTKSGLNIIDFKKVPRTSEHKTDRENNNIKISNKTHSLKIIENNKTKKNLKFCKTSFLRNQKIKKLR